MDRPAVPPCNPPAGGQASIGGGRDQIASDAAFAGANADRLLDVGHENLAVADAAGLRSLADRVDGALDHVVAEHDLDLHLGQEVDDVFGAAIELGMTLLAAEPLGLRHGDSLQTDFLERFLHLIELERLDDRFDLLHWLRVSDDSAATGRLTPVSARGELQTPCQPGRLWNPPEIWASPCGAA